MTCKDCGWKWVNLDGEIFCGYSNAKTCEDESCCAWKPVKVGTGITPYTEEDWKRTNAVRIRSMPDDELAVWIAETSNCSDWCKLSDVCEKKQEFECCINVWRNWLKQEVK